MSKKNDNTDEDYLKYMPQTKQHIIGMTQILQDEKTTKADALVELADAKIAMFKEDEDLRRNMVTLETRLASTEQQLEKAKRDNIDLVDKIQAQRGPSGVDFAEGENAEVKKVKAEKRELQYQSYIRQFGKEYADEIMKDYQD